MVFRFVREGGYDNTLESADLSQFFNAKEKMGKGTGAEGAAEEGQTVAEWIWCVHRMCFVGFASDALLSVSFRFGFAPDVVLWQC